MAKQNTKLAEVFHFDLQGKREDKYDFLNENSLSSIEWNTLEPNEPYHFFVIKDFRGSHEYGLGFKVDDLFVIQSLGIEFGSKEYFLDDSKSRIINFITEVSHF